MAFPIIRKQNAPQVGMPGKPNPKEIINFPLQPIGARPHRHQRIDNRVIAAEPHPQSHFFTPRDGNQVIVQFESWLSRITVHAGGIGKKVVLQLGVPAAVFCRGSEEFARHDDRGLAPECNHFHDRFRVPRTQAFGYNISVFTGRLRHDFESQMRRLFMPVQRALFPEIQITDQQDGYVEHHLPEAVPPQTAKDVGPGVQEDGFHIEQNENHRHEVELDGEGFPRVTCGFHAAFVRLLVGPKTRADTDMPFGHNSNVTVAGDTYHVQTEERGAAHALIDTTVYLRGRVLHRRTNSFSDLLPLNSDREQALKLRVDTQHRSVVDEIRTGKLRLALPSDGKTRGHTPAPAESAAAIHLELLNAKTWLSGKRALLQIAVNDPASKVL